MSARPLILITPDVEVREQTRGPTRYHVLEQSYAQAVLEAGGIPWVAPYTDDDEVIDAYLDRVDGVLLTGGAFDVDPSLFGEEPHESLGTLKPDRTAFEVAIYRGAVTRELPVLGICGGMQLMNVMREGTLYQDIPSQREGALDHEKPGPKDAVSHRVEVTPGTLFARIVGDETLGVNSTHHQAVRDVGQGLTASGVATDGIAEVIEDATARFFLGVQWHPEAMSDARNRAIYRAFIDAARR